MKWLFVVDKCAFRVCHKESNQSHTLHARDEHDKRQWLASLQSAVDKISSSTEHTDLSHVSSTGSDDNTALEQDECKSLDETPARVHKQETVV